MQIVMRLSDARFPEEAAKLVAQLLRRVLPASDVRRTSLEPVFPGVTTGRRAGMMVLSLDDRTPPARVSKLLDALRRSKSVEYAAPAAEKTPVGR